MLYNTTEYAVSSRCYGVSLSNPSIGIIKLIYCISVDLAVHSN